MAATAPLADILIAPKMRPMKIALALCTLVLATSVSQEAGSTRRPSALADDLVIFGRVKSLKDEAIDDLSMDTLITARLTITRVVRGHPPASVLTIKYVAHTDFVEDREFRFHLRRSKDGIWLACGDGSRGYLCR